MYIKAEIELVEGKAAQLSKMIQEIFEPVMAECGWQLVVSMRSKDNPNQITNIWDVGASPDAGFENIRSRPDYAEIKANMSECVLSETLIFMDNW